MLVGVWVPMEVRELVAAPPLTVRLWCMISILHLLSVAICEWAVQLTRRV